MVKFCGNPKCINHIDVKEGTTTLRKYVDSQDYKNHLLISNASVKFGINDKTRIIRLCDICKEAIEIYIDFKGLDQ